VAWIVILLVLILAWVDKQWVSPAKSQLRGWRDPAHYGLVLVGALIVIYVVRTFTEALGGALEGYLGLARARSAATFVSVILYSIVVVPGQDLHLGCAVQASHVVRTSTL
jgi:small-conductance mechanosensitive channel